MLHVNLSIPKLLQKIEKVPKRPGPFYEFQNQMKIITENDQLMSLTGKLNAKILCEISAN